MFLEDASFIAGRSSFGKISYNYFLLNKKISSKFGGLHYPVKFLDLGMKRFYAWSSEVQSSEVQGSEVQGSALPLA